jgi:hypothetical protein
MKKKFNINDYKDDYVMHCNTEEKANVFCKYLNSVGRKWNSDCSYLEKNEWNKYKKDTCYNFNYGTFCDYNSYCIDYTILEFDNFDWSEEEEKENKMKKEFTKSDLKNGMVVETREMERKVYSSWAFTENENEKRDTNTSIYNELNEKYKITRLYKDTNVDDFDLVIDRKRGYNHSTYSIVKNETNLSKDELALICDNGNLCFGYSKQGNSFYIFED